LLGDFARSENIRQPVVWFYTPMALEYVPLTMEPRCVIYDCMDELSGFRGAPLKLQENEQRLFQMANAVFTGGVSLFEAKRACCAHAYPFPSGVDILHFAQARHITAEPEDQATIPHPRLGFAGVIDERMNLELIDGIARMRPEWQIVMLGPVVKIDPSTLPRSSNIHWLGMKSYRDLPAYFSSWDLAMLPFALNEATRFISPTKTPEYLAAGLPVVSTPIRDVVRPYGELGLVRIAHTTEEFVSAAEQAMTCGMSLKWRERADGYLQTLTWDSVWQGMNEVIAATLNSARVDPNAARPVREAAHV
jgi:UDP-galactopyranose mutase